MTTQATEPEQQLMTPAESAARIAPPPPNTALLRATLQRIETHPEEWNQRRWRYGTAARAALLDAGVWERSDVHSVDPYMVARDTDPAVETWMDVCGSGHRVIHVAARARHILGLTAEQADGLFYADTLDDLRAQVAALAGQDGAR